MAKHRPDPDKPPRPWTADELAAGGATEFARTPLTPIYRATIALLIRDRDGHFRDAAVVAAHIHTVSDAVAAWYAATDGASLSRPSRQLRIDYRHFDDALRKDA